MPKAAVDFSQIRAGAQGLARQSWFLVASGCVALALSLVAPDRRMSLTALVIGLTLLAMVALLRFFSNAGSRSAAQQRAMLHQLLDPDPAPCFTTDGRGEILYRNPAAQTRFAAGGIRLSAH